MGIARLLKKMDQAHQCEFVMGIVEQKEIRRPPAVSHVGWKYIRVVINVIPMVAEKVFQATLACRPSMKRKPGGPIHARRFMSPKPTQ